MSTGYNMHDWEFELPIYMQVGKKKISVAVNWYRNAHYQVSNNAKRKYKKLIEDQFSGLTKPAGKIHVTYEYYAARNNKPDLDNMTGTVKKFFQDAMVELGFIEDDNVSIIVSTKEKYMGIDRENPRVVAKITQLEK